MSKFNIYFYFFFFNHFKNVFLRMEISEVEERKNSHISDLVKHHEKAFNEMKNYYNDITLNNLALISALKVSFI